MKKILTLISIFGALIGPLFADATLTNWQNTKILHVTVTVHNTEDVYYPGVGTSHGSWNNTEQYTLGYLEALDLIDGSDYYESGEEQHNVSWTYSITYITEENNPSPPPSIFPDDPPPGTPPPENLPPSISVSSMSYSSAGGGTVHISGTASDPEGQLSTICVLFTWSSYAEAQAHGFVVYTRWIPVNELTWSGDTFSGDISLGTFEKCDSTSVTYNYTPPPESYFVAVYVSDIYYAGASALPGLLTISP